ncbi:hypothetical protein HYS50_00080 [Candidatus Woesearchaeota archaeon]|nr:hypothetical protein [Candidatus Woesearchaeota archaeon]
MKTKCIRVEQKEANTLEVDSKVNEEIRRLEQQGHKIKDIKIAVGRDADITAGLEKKYSISIILIYE